MKPIITIFIVFFLLGHSLWAEALRIEVGGGRLSLHIESGDRKEIEKIERELLIDEDLASIVMGNHALSISIDTKDLEGEDLKEGIKVLLTEKRVSAHFKEALKALIQEKLEPQVSTRNRKIRKDWGDQEDREDREGRQHVVLGSQHLTVEESEFFEEVVVIGGGRVDIYGEVDHLVVIGGNVHIHKGGVVEDLVTIGGYVQKAPGSKVNGDFINIGPFTHLNEFSDSMKVFGTLMDLMEGRARLIFIIFEMLVIILMLWLCIYLYPSLHRRTQELITQSPGWDLLYSLLYILLLGPMVILLLVSVIGIPLLPLIFSLSFVFVFLGCGESALWLGNQLNKKFALLSPRWEILLAISGLALVELMTFIPYVGFLIKFFFYVVGFGAILKALYDLQRSRGAREV